MVLKTIDVRDSVMQILGTAGSLETIFELVYVSTETSIFTKFERFFFIYTASWELFAQVVVLLSLWEVLFPRDADGDVGKGDSEPGDSSSDGEEEGKGSEECDVCNLGWKVEGSWEHDDNGIREEGVYRIGNREEGGGNADVVGEGKGEGVAINGDCVETAKAERRVGAFRPRDIAKVLLRDPVHNLAYPVDLTRKDGEGSRPPGTLHRVYEQHPTLGEFFATLWPGVGAPGFYIVIWAVFLPMWGMFDGGDFNLRVWICVSFWIWLLVVIFLSFRTKIGFNSRWIFVMVTAYALNKAVEVFLLFSSGGRLADGFVGQGLRYLQALGLGSVLIIMYRALLADIYEDHSLPASV